MRPLAVALAKEGYTVTLPRLPGHGTTVEDMTTTTWSDWLGAVDQAYTNLAQACPKVVVVGLSMGGTLILDLATTNPEIAGVVAINAPSTTNPTVVAQIDGLIAGGERTIDSIGNDIAKPDTDEASYDATPLLPLKSLFDAIDRLQAQLRNITMPTLLITSHQDHVVPPSDSDNTATSIGTVAERLWLDNSYHVATLDYDQAAIISTTSEFIARVTAKDQRVGQRQT